MKLKYLLEKKSLAIKISIDICPTAIGSCCQADFSTP